MEKILLIAHTQADGKLPKIVLETLNAAIDLTGKLGGAPLTVGLIGENVKEAADSISTCGAASFLAVEGADFSVSRYSSDAAAIEALVRKSEASIVLAPTTSRFSRAIPGAVFRLKGRVETHVSGIDVENGQLTIQRWYYRQRMVARLTREQRPWFLVVDSGILPGWQGAAASAAIEHVTVAATDFSRTQVLGIQAAAGGGSQTVRPEAEVLFVAGAGWTKKQSDGQIHGKEAESTILGFLENCNASLGSSKSLVDQSHEGEAVLPFMSHLNQVGQTGSTPRHPKGLSTCCHGEEPHAVGWRFINERRAINLDPNCGWAQGKADVLYVADAFQVMAKVNEMLKK